MTQRETQLTDALRELVYAADTVAGNDADEQYAKKSAGAYQWVQVPLPAWRSLHTALATAEKLLAEQPPQPESK